MSPKDKRTIARLTQGDLWLNSATPQPYAGGSADGYAPSHHDPGWGRSLSAG